MRIAHVGLFLGALLSLCSFGTRANAEEHHLERAKQTETVDAPVLTPVELEQRWLEFWTAEDETQQDEAFESFLSCARELGVPNLRNHSRLLLLSASQANEGNSVRDTNRLVAFAARLSMDSPEAAFFQASQIWRSSPWNLPATISQLATGASQSMDYASVRIILELHAYKVVWYTLLGLTIIFLLTQLSRHFKFAAYDLASVFSHVVPVLWAGLVIGCAALLPSILFRSPLMAIGLGFVAVWAYQGRSERLVSVVLVAGLLAAPLLAQRIGALVASSASVSSFLQEAQDSPCDGRCQSRLSDLAEHPTFGPYAAYTQGLLLARQGGQEDLKSAWDLLSEQRFNEEAQPSADLLRATILALSGYGGDARRDYEDLVNAGSLTSEQLVAAHFNLARVFEDLGSAQSRDEHLSLARDFDHEKVLEAIRVGERRTNLWLMTPGMPSEVLYLMAVSPDSHTSWSARDELWRPLGGQVAPTVMQAVLLGFLGFCLLMTVLSRQMKPSKGCPKCGSVMSIRETPTEAGAGYCSDCYQLFMEGASLNAEERSTYEKSVESHQQGLRRLIVIGNVAGSGAGFLFSGRAWLGAPLLAVGILGFVLIFCPTAALASSFEVSTSQFDGRLLLAAACLTFAYGTSWFLTWFKRHSLIGSQS